MKKRIKISINEVPRENRIVNINEISKMLRRKWIKTALKESDQFNIHVFPQGFVEEYTQGGWQVSNKGDNVIIKVKDCIGHEQEYDIDKLIKERDSKSKNIKVNIFENVIAQAELIFLTGEHKDFECAFNHITNRIKYEINKTKNGGTDERLVTLDK